MKRAAKMIAFILPAETSAREEKGPKYVGKDGKFANGQLTVEFACLACYAEKDRAWAIATSKGIHALGKK